MRHYRITDENGDKFEVEEEVVDEEINENPEDIHDDDQTQLSAEEITALKGLAAVADKLVALVQSKDSDEDETLDDEDEEERGFEDEDTNEEEVIDTDEEEMPATHDSKTSFGANEKRRTRTVDNSLKDDISDAWQKRYGGQK